MGDAVTAPGHVDVETSTLRLIRRRLVGIFVGIVIIAGAAVRSEMAARDAHHAAETVEAENRKAAAERCRVTLLRQDRSLDKDVQIFTQLGHELGAPQERIDGFIEGIRAIYAALPLPADCALSEEEDPDAHRP